jgi:hypothetical protein
MDGIWKYADISPHCVLSDSINIIRPADIESSTLKILQYVN